MNSGFIDANILVYAINADALQHQPSRALLLEAKSSNVTHSFVSSQVLCEFYSIVTNKRKMSRPLSHSQATGTISSFISFLNVLPTPANAVNEWMALLERHPVTGSDVFDLQIIATMKANGIHRIYTYNQKDFAAFQEIEVLTP